MHCLKNIYFVSIHSFINTKGSEICSFYGCLHISQEKQSVFIESSPSLKDVIFQKRTQTLKGDDPYNYIL